MNAFKWAVVAVLAFDALYYVSKTGKPRQPITGYEAVCGLIEFGPLIWLVVLA